MPAITVEALLDAPCPRAGITVSELGTGDTVVNLWRLADGERHPVRGVRRHKMIDSGFFTDWDAPLARPVTYELEVLSSDSGASRTTSEPVEIASATGWLLDPLVPQTAVPVVGERRDDGDIYLRGDALADLEYRADVSIFNVMGSSKPMALFGQRMAESGLDTSLGTRSATENTRLKRLLRSTAQLLFKPLPVWGELDLVGTMFLSNPTVRQTPVNVLMGGKLTWWDLKSDVVAAPAIKVLTATFTYGDVKMMTATYQQKQDAMAGKTYLDDLKNPLG